MFSRKKDPPPTAPRKGDGAKLMAQVCIQIKSNHLFRQADTKKNVDKTVTVNTQSAPSAHRRASEQLPPLLLSRRAAHSGSSSGIGGGVNKEATVVE